MGKPIPKPSFLDGLESMGAFDGHKRWRNENGSRLYTWDSLHGEIEMFNARGRHLGALDAVSGDLIKLPVAGRKINV